MSAMSLFAGKIAVVKPEPKNLMDGMSANHEMTPPPNRYPAMRGPMM